MSDEQSGASSSAGTRAVTPAEVSSKGRLARALLTVAERGWNWPGPHRRTRGLPAWQCRKADGGNAKQYPRGHRAADRRSGPPLRHSIPEVPLRMLSSQGPAAGTQPNGRKEKRSGPVRAGGDWLGTGIGGMTGAFQVRDTFGLRSRPPGKQAAIKRQISRLGNTGNTRKPRKPVEKPGPAADPESMVVSPGFSTGS